MGRTIRNDSALDAGQVTVFVTDNGSRDGTIPVAEHFAPWVHLVHSRARYVSGVRNDGVRAVVEEMGPFDALVFLDADCIVPPGFFSACIDVFAQTGAHAIGCEVYAPPDGHWTERAWDALHRPGGDGPRHYINSACFAIRRATFEALGGFDPDRPSSEDVDICQRLLASGGRLFQSERLAVLHLGNPQSLRGLWRRIRWHNEGVFDAAGHMQRAPMVYATLLHGAVIVLAVATALPLAPIAPLMSAALIGTGLLLIPFLFVLARMRQFRRYIPMLSATALMALTFPARLHGMWRRWRHGDSIPSR
jgi:GT2 family glycosyltransferase